MIGAKTVRDAIMERITTLPVQLRRSLTWDQGAEMTQHAQLRIQTGLPVYFCDPQSPSQRAINENTNGLLRQYFPKSTDLSRHITQDLAAVATTLIAVPARCLAGDTSRGPHQTPTQPRDIRHDSSGIFDRQR